MTDGATQRPARPLRAVSAIPTLIALLCLLAAGTARAEPYIAVREGYKCSVCHVNMTGGGKRTDFANVYIQTRLPMVHVDWPPSGGLAGESDATAATLYNGRVNEFLAFGGDLRVEATQTEVRNEPAARQFSLAKGLLYVQMDLIPDAATFYIDQELSGAAATREFFMLFKGLGVDAYAKIGRFFLPSGLRLQDDTSFIRSVTRFNYGVTDTGFELGVEPGPFAMSVAVTNGATDAHKKVSGYGYGLWRYGMLGLSSSIEHDTDENVRRVANVFGGLHLGRFTALAEVDRITDTATALEQQTALVELNVLVADGANLKLTYEWHEPDVDVQELNQDRTSVVFEPFVTQFLQVRLGTRNRDGPKEDPAANADLHFIEFHVYF